MPESQFAQPWIAESRLLEGLAPVSKLPHNSACYHSSRQKWCPEYEAGMFQAIVEHTAAELFDAATQARCTTFVTMRSRIDRRAKRSRRWLSIAKARATFTVK